MFFQNLKVLLKKFHVQLAEDIHKKTVELLQDCHEWSLQDVVTTVESALWGKHVDNNFINNELFFIVLQFVLLWFHTTTVRVLDPTYATYYILKKET